MQTEPKFVCIGFSSSDALNYLVDHRIAALEKYFPRIITCRVALELPHRHHHQGNHWHLKLTVAVPGEDIVITREAGVGQRHEHPAAAIRDAFDAARRRLQDHARRIDGRVKHHEEPPAATILALGSDHGFITTDDGRQIYFHENAVLDHRFDELHIGTRVTFHEEDGIEGPQASSVRLLR